ncbi:anti-sigma factor [Parafrankia discariae]|uniref:anti-sigma factor n=1 Tax=Parafrankia discariae TaxID=365528 RepID=UPI0003692118|nr:anti-sigma factor [Parafrankia discariae]
MTADAHSLVAARALDAVDPAEAALVDAHLEQCGFCADELFHLSAATEHLAAIATEQPPPGLRADLLAVIGTTPQFRPRVSADRAVPPTGRPDQTGRQGGPDRRRRRPRARHALVGVAAGVLAAGAALGTVTVNQRAELADTRAQVADAQALAASALTVADSAPVAGGGELTMANAGNLAVVSARDLPPLDAGKVYQLWLLGPRGARSAGMTVGTARSGDWIVGNVGDADRVALTVEPAGGSPQPTTDPVGAVALKAQQTAGRKHG